MDAGEEPGKVVIIVLGVAFQGVVMALGATDAGAQEGLGHGGHHLGALGLPVLADGDQEIADGGVVARAAAGRQHVPGDLIPRPLLNQLLAQPFMEGAHALGAAHVVVALLAVLKQVSQEQGPVIDKLRPLEQGVDGASAFIRALVGQEGPHFLGRGQHANGVQKRPAQKRGVVARARRLDPQGGELVEHVLIDEIAALGQPCRIDRLLVRSGQDNHRDLALKADAQRRFAVAQHLDQPLGIDAGHARVVGIETAQPGHVARRAVGVPGTDLELQFLPRAQCSRDWPNLERLDAGIVLGWPGAPARTQSRRTW